MFKKTFLKQRLWNGALPVTDIRANTKMDTSVRASGLSISEIQHIMVRNGRNVCRSLRRVSLTNELLNYLKNPLFLVIGFLAAAVGFVNIFVMGYVLGMILYMSRTVMFNRTVDRINRILTADVLVIREGLGRRLPATELVPGDIIVLTAGDDVPANVRFFQDSTLTADHAGQFGSKIIAGDGLAVVLQTGADLFNNGSTAKNSSSLVLAIKKIVEAFTKSKQQTISASTDSDVRSDAFTNVALKELESNIIPEFLDESLQSSRRSLEAERPSQSTRAHFSNAFLRAA
ncbi:hypothetical protein FHQ08_00965 [Lactobacillus sp. CC-MHH1034]|uniref:P-type ATPase n=1 Tax=Agrilactobacillus fermenti TaxID=2586909 RepID=UPI001E5A966C|nr:hypothetical protein [Agrilactobacillus fermenti]MCD2255279.1 hypothetical protein [Agrilactobacillus fermenti]